MFQNVVINTIGSALRGYSHGMASQGSHMTASRGRIGLEADLTLDVQAYSCVVNLVEVLHFDCDLSPSSLPRPSATP